MAATVGRTHSMSHLPAGNLRSLGQLAVQALLPAVQARTNRLGIRPLYRVGVLPWPHVPLEDLDIAARFAVLDLAEDVQAASVILLLVLIPAHPGAALKHHLCDPHDVLRGMLPEILDREDNRGGSHRTRTVGALPKGAKAG